MMIHFKVSDLILQQGEEQMVVIILQKYFSILIVSLQLLGVNYLQE